MDDTIKAITALIAALGGAVVVLHKILQDVKRQLRASRESVDTVWDAQLNRGRAEALQHDLVVESFDPDFDPADDAATFGTLAPRARAAKCFEKIAPHLIALRRAHPDASESAFAQLVERHFGLWITRNVCRKLGIYQFACIVLATLVADGVPPVPDSSYD
jgi:hypothetical protein